MLDHEREINEESEFIRRAVVGGALGGIALGIVLVVVFGVFQVGSP